MRTALPVIALLALALAACAADTPQELGPVRVGPDDWPWWRGPTRDGVAAGTVPPLTWGAEENVLWSAPVPGRGHGSPTVAGKHVYLATAETDRDVQSVLCFDRDTGKQLWQTEVHKGGTVAKGGNDKASFASATVACDGERLFVNFLNTGAIYTTALALDGTRLWQTKVSDYTLHQGFGSSPAIFEGLVLVTADNKGGGVVAALGRANGKVVWSQPRPKQPNYASPIVLKAAGKDQLVLTGCDLVAGLEPLTGKKLWEVKGSTTECVTSAVTDGERVFTSGGYPKNHVSAVKADDGTVAWENGTRVYVPSMIVKDGYLYAVADAGVAVCWKSDTGKEMWKGRLGGTFSGSAVLVGDHLMATNESGKTYVWRATPDKFESIGANQLGDDSYSTPAICGGRVYLRAAVRDKGQRREMLYCVGKK